MLSYGGVDLQVPSAEEAAWIEARIPIAEAFGFFRARWLGGPKLNPRTHFAWFLNRPFKLNSFYSPWGASRWGYSFVLADTKMHAAIIAQNEAGESLTFTIGDGVGNAISTDLYMLPPVPLSKILTTPSLPLYLIPLVDERYYWWEVAEEIEVDEGTTTWAQVYTAIETALAITITVDPVASAYLKPGAGLTQRYQHLPLLLDLVASSVGQRIVRKLDGTIKALNAASGQTLMIAQANQHKKYAGGSLNLGVVNA